MKIIFAGTPPFAATALEQLIKAGHDIVMVLSQPDRPCGRGMKIKASPVKELAVSQNIEVLTPITLSLKKSPEEAESIYKKLQETNADLLVVAAYGLIIPQRFLDLPMGIGINQAIKAINIHGSILPRWRGAAPVARAIECGDRFTGVDLMKMEAGLDTGPVIAQVQTPISDQDTSDTLMNRLAILGSELLVESLKKADTLTFKEQSEDGILYAEKIQKDEAPIDWNLSADEIERKIRAFTPFPGTTFKKENEIIKAWKAEKVDHQNVHPGTILDTHNGLLVSCGENALLITTLQKAGKPKMDYKAFLQSVHFEIGEVLK